jgi:hypothetical protein
VFEFMTLLLQPGGYSQTRLLDMGVRHLGEMLDGVREVEDTDRVGVM